MQYVHDRPAAGAEQQIWAGRGDPGSDLRLTVNFIIDYTADYIHDKSNNHWVHEMSVCIIFTVQNTKTLRLLSQMTKKRSKCSHLRSWNQQMSDKNQIKSSPVM